MEFNTTIHASLCHLIFLPQSGPGRDWPTGEGFDPSVFKSYVMRGPEVWKISRIGEITAFSPVSVT